MYSDMPYVHIDHDQQDQQDQQDRYYVSVVDTYGDTIGRTYECTTSQSAHELADRLSHKLGEIPVEVFA